MAKNNHFSWLLLFALVCLHLHFSSYTVASPVSAVDLIDYPPHVSERAVLTEALEGLKKRARTKKIYDAQIGVREQGTNAGKAIEAYLRYTGLGKGHPWCAAFVCWVYGQADVSNPKSAWSPSLFPKSKLIWQKQSPIVRHGGSSPQTGDIFSIYFPDKGRIAHTGFVDKWDKNWVITVEGNTNLSGAREGDGVYRKRRPVASLHSVADWISEKGGHDAK